MAYIAIYEDPWDQDGTSENGTHVTHVVKLQVGSNISLSDEEVKKQLRRYLTERLRVANIKEEKIRIELGLG